MLEDFTRDYGNKIKFKGASMPDNASSYSCPAEYMFSNYISGSLNNSSNLSNGETITFEWNEVPGATEYSFVLYRKERNGNLVPVWSEKNVKGNKVRLRKLSVLDVGNFEWYVTAYTYAKDGFEERHSDTVRSSFTIKFDSPIQITPEKNGRMYSAD